MGSMQAGGDRSGEHRWIIHIDMDAFYASVEQRDHPVYRGRPVIVGADPKSGKGRGVVSAASYEARVFGIHSAMPISQAYRRCPEGVFLPVRMSRYRAVSVQIFQIFARYTDLVEPLSLDEAFLDVTGSLRLFGPAEIIGRRIQAEIRAGTGLGASVGIAANKFVAKVASDLRKPNGFVIVPPGQEAGFLQGLPIERLWGVGPKTAGRLRRMGCMTIGEVAARSQMELAATFGQLGAHLWELAQGIDTREVIPEESAQSVGAETTFAEDTADPVRIRQTLLALSERVARRLRVDALQAGVLTLKLRDETFRTQTRSVSLSEPTDQSQDLYWTAMMLLERLPSSGRKVRLLGVTASKLSDRAGSGQQLSLELDPAGAKQRRLTEAVDRIQARFGKKAIRPASLLSSS
ncbi:DNA polymerase IV [Candidatus Methylomirabilis sp.]|uniref:DNA polymerase IV n=1 Tax=Candidatus Methylomirabilis sp. TaxID=2032687 RepID=UPI002A6958D6|nr:DNA polymerase IV [Candidatus Methylomirabilis sp.]